MVSYSDDPSFFGPQLPGVDTLYAGPTISISPAYKSALNSAGLSLSAPANVQAFNSAFRPQASAVNESQSSSMGGVVLLGLAAVAVLLMRRR